jgi:hypothetical protein
MWFLLLIITSYLNRNHFPEFSDLYELLYKDEEMLPNPDLASFISVIRLAPLSIWINLNLRNQDSSAPNASSNAAHATNNRLSNLNRTFVVPEILRNHFALLQDCMTYQQYHDFGLSISLNACKNFCSK